MLFVYYNIILRILLFFRMEKYLEDIFHHMHAAYKHIDSRLKAEGFKMRVMQVCRAWDDWAIYSKDLIQKLKNIFLGSSAAAIMVISYI